MRILRASDYRRMPWKNGGGETAEIAVFPEGRGLEDFVWRVSMARVAASGPFSLFPGVDRTLSILAGEGLALHVAGSASLELTGGSEPFGFPADVAVSARLLDGPVTDLNVMTRRGEAKHRVARLSLENTAEIKLESTHMLLVCCKGTIKLNTDYGEAVLGQLDTVAAGSGLSALRIIPDSSAELYLIEIQALS